MVLVAQQASAEYALIEIYIFICFFFAWEFFFRIEVDTELFCFLTHITRSLTLQQYRFSLTNITNWEMDILCVVLIIHTTYVDISSLSYKDHWIFCLKYVSLSWAHTTRAIRTRSTEKWRKNIRIQSCFSLMANLSCFFLFLILLFCLALRSLMIYNLHWIITIALLLTFLFFFVLSSHFFCYQSDNNNTAAIFIKLFSLLLLDNSQCLRFQ